MLRELIEAMLRGFMEAVLKELMDAVLRGVYGSGGDIPVVIVSSTSPPTKKKN